MKQLDDWLIDGYGSLRGNVLDADGKFVMAVHTSTVVKREGNVVITRSGSRYQLLEPSKIHMDRFMLDKFFGGAADALAAIDYRIFNHD